MIHLRRASAFRLARTVLVFTTGSLALGACQTFAGYTPPPPMPASPPSFYVDVSVGSPGVKFLFIRQDTWERLSANELERRARLLETDGDFPVTGRLELQLRVSTTYLFFPVCDGQVAWARRVSRYVTNSQAIVVDC